MTHLSFGQPLWLGIGALVCLSVLLVTARADRLRRRACAVLAGAHAAVTLGRGRRLAKRALLLLGAGCAFLALARPRWGYRWEVDRQSGIDLMFAVDTSKSMRAQDLAPDRLTRAKLAVADLVRELPGARAGLIAFAGTAFVQAPMTLDQAVFGEALDALDTDIIPRGGTNVGAAIDTAVGAMASEPDRHKVLVLLSDGEDLEGDAAAAAARAARAGVVIDTVGVGTPAGAMVPIDRDGRPGPMRDATGAPVRSRLDEATLRRLAAITGGAYAPLGASGAGLETLYRQHLAQLPRRAAEERMHKVWTERFQIPLGAAIACLLAELAVGERRRRGVMVAGPAALLLLLGVPRLAAAAQPASPSPTSTYNDGTAAYRQRDYASAEQRFQRATHTTDLGLQEDAYYDLGNAHYRRGEAALGRSPDRAAAIAAWKEALTAYDGALVLQPKDADARFNRDLVGRRLAALERKQQQQQQQQHNQSPQNQGDSGKTGGAPKSGAPAGGAGQASAQNGQQGKSPSKTSGGAQPSGAPAGAAQPDHQSASGEQGRTQGSGSAEPQQQRQQGEPPGKRPSQANGGAGRQPTPTPTGPGVVSGGADQNGEARAETAAARRDPNALTHGEAVQLLDSVRGETRRLPAAGDSRHQAGAEDEPAKDW